MKSIPCTLNAILIAHNYPLGWGGLPYERCGDARRLAYGCKFRVLVSLGVFIAKQDERLIFFSIRFIYSIHVIIV